MNFPERLDQEDMELVKKEWTLSGLDVVEGPWEVDGKMVEQVIIGKNRPRHHLLSWFWFTRYDLEGEYWVKKIDQERHHDHHDPRCDGLS